MLTLLYSLFSVLVDVFWFWVRKIVGRIESQFQPERWSHQLVTASSYTEWAQAAQHLDVPLGRDYWRRSPASPLYDYELIDSRVTLIRDMRREGNVYGLMNVLRSGLLRNLGNITAPKLFNISFAGTKCLIEDYISEYMAAIVDIASLPPPASGDGSQSPVELVPAEWEDGEISGGGGGAAFDHVSGQLASEDVRPPRGGLANATIPTQHKLDFIRDTRQGFGRSALVLQGGAIFGMCHLGVVKALHEQGLLPRIIVGTAIGAMMAALVGVHPEEDLLPILTGEGIDLSAFAGKTSEAHSRSRGGFKQSMQTRWATLVRRVRRFRKDGYFLDVKVLEECVRANVGDLTFEEAFNRSRRILNITVVTDDNEGIPTLLNYVTTPNVLVWTAAVASNASSSTFYGRRQTKILCKDAHGNIGPWAPADTVNFRHWTHASSASRNAPLQRVARLFNVNHYVVSQARPYLVPFLQSDMHGPPVYTAHSRVTGACLMGMRLVGLEMRHRLRQLDHLGLLPLSIRRFLVDEHLPGPSMTLVPDVDARDFLRLLETPTRETVDYWILRGARSVWPAVAALKVRCAIEMELDRVYQDVRRHKALDLKRRASGVGRGMGVGQRGGRRERERERERERGEGLQEQE